MWPNQLQWVSKAIHNDARPCTSEVINVVLQVLKQEFTCSWTALQAFSRWITLDESLDATLDLDMVGRWTKAVEGDREYIINQSGIRI